VTFWTFDSSWTCGNIEEVCITFSQILRQQWRVPLTYRGCFTHILAYVLCSSQKFTQVYKWIHFMFTLLIVMVYKRASFSFIYITAVLFCKINVNSFDRRNATVLCHFYRSSSMTGATWGAGTTYLSEHLNFSWVRIVRSPVFCDGFILCLLF
jgi:hypothetical protein